MAEQVGDAAQHRAQIAAADEVEIERPGARRILDPGAAVERSPASIVAGAGVVEEQRVAGAASSSGIAMSAPLAVIDLVVPQPPRRAEPVELLAALAEPVEVLLAGSMGMRSATPPASAGASTAPARRGMAATARPGGARSARKDTRARSPAPRRSRNSPSPQASLTTMAFPLRCTGTIGNPPFPCHRLPVTAPFQLTGG